MSDSSILNRFINGLNAMTHALPIVGYISPKIDRVDYWFSAYDAYRRSKYSLEEPEWLWGKHLITGIYWGDYFADKRDAHLYGLSLSYYNGPNPHGQFRNKKISYWALAFSVQM